MNYDHYKTASEATDVDERALIPGFKRMRPVDQEAQRETWDAKREHDRDLEHESRESEEREASGYWDNHPDNEGDQ